MGDGEKTRPSVPSWLERDFVERALREGEKDSTIKVLSYEVQKANAVGDGYASDMYRIIINIENSQERRIIAKCLPQTGRIKEAVKSVGAFEKETLMLAMTLPAMQKLLEDERPGEFEPFAAKCLYHGTDPTDYIVVEDLRQSGFTLAKRQLGLDLAHCRLVMKTLGRFHASSIALLDRHPEIAVNFDKGLYREETRPQLGSFINNALRDLAKEVSKWPGFERYVAKLNNMREVAFTRMIELCRRKDGELNVLIHGDCWTSNMMFKYSGDIPQHMRLVDFQTSYISSPAIDLHYFLNSCPNMDVILNHIHSLLEEYHQVFAETLDLLGSSKYVISLEQVQKMYKNYLPYGFMCAAAVLPVVLSSPENGFDVEAAFGDQSVNDNNWKLYSNRDYVQVMKFLLPKFDENGVLD